ncbi:hypothetical protein WDU94_008766 [Cyamophila willieti]
MSRQSFSQLKKVPLPNNPTQSKVFVQQFGSENSNNVMDFRQERWMQFRSRKVEEEIRRNIEKEEELRRKIRIMTIEELLKQSNWRQQEEWTEKGEGRREEQKRDRLRSRKSVDKQEKRAHYRSRILADREEESRRHEEERRTHIKPERNLCRTKRIVGVIRGIQMNKTRLREKTRNKQMMLGSNNSSSTQYSQWFDRLCNNFIQQDSISAQDCSDYRNSYNPSYNNGSSNQNNNSYYQNYISSFDNHNFSNNYCQQTSSWTNSHYTGDSLVTRSQNFGNLELSPDSGYSEDRRVYSEPRGGYTRTVEFSSNARSSSDRPGPYRGDVERPKRWRRDSGDCRMDLEEQTNHFIRNNKRVISSREDREYSHDIRYNEQHIKKLVKKVIKKHVREEIPKSKRGEAEKPGRHTKTREDKGSGKISKSMKTNNLDDSRIDKCDRRMGKLDFCKTNEKLSTNIEKGPVKNDGSKTSQTSTVVNSSVQKKPNEKSSSKEIVPGSYFKSTCRKEDKSKVGEHCTTNSDSKSTNTAIENEALDKIDGSDEINKTSSSESAKKTRNNGDSAEKVTSCEQTEIDKTVNAHLLDNSNNESNIRDEKIEPSLTDNLLNMPLNEVHRIAMEIEESKTVSTSLETESTERENDNKNVKSCGEIPNTDKEHVNKDCMIVDNDCMIDENEDNVERLESTGNESITENESFVVIDEITEADDEEVKCVTNVERSPKMETTVETNDNQEPLFDIVKKTTETIVQDVINAMVDNISNSFNNTPSKETKSNEMDAVNDTSCDKTTSKSDTVATDHAIVLGANKHENLNSINLKESKNSKPSSNVALEHSQSQSKERNHIENDSPFTKHHSTELDHAENFVDNLDDENNNKKAIQENRFPGKSKKYKKNISLFEARSTYRIRKHYNIKEYRNMDKELGTDQFIAQYNNHIRLQSPYLNTNQDYDFYGQHCSRSSSRESSSYQKYSYRNTTSYSQSRKYGDETYQRHNKVERRYSNRTESKRQDFEGYNVKKKSELCSENNNTQYSTNISAGRIPKNSEVDMNKSHEHSFLRKNCLLPSVPSNQTSDGCEEVVLYDGLPHKCHSNSDKTSAHHIRPNQCQYCIALMHYQHFHQLQIAHVNTTPMAIGEGEHNSVHRSRKSIEERKYSSQKSSEERKSSKSSSRRSSEERNSSKSSSRRSSEERKSRNKKSKSSSLKDEKVLNSLAIALCQKLMKLSMKKRNPSKKIEMNSHKNKLRVRRPSRRQKRKLKKTLSKRLERSNQQRRSSSCSNSIINQINAESPENEVRSNNEPTLESLKPPEPENTESATSELNLPGILSFKDVCRNILNDRDTFVKSNSKALKEKSPSHSVSSDSTILEKSNSDKTTNEEYLTIETSKTDESVDNYRKKSTSVESNSLSSKETPIVNEAKDKKIVSDRKELRISIDLCSIGPDIHSIIKTTCLKESDDKSPCKIQTSPVSVGSAQSTAKDSTVPNEEKLRNSVEKVMEIKPPVLQENSSKIVLSSTENSEISPNESPDRFKIKNTILDQKFKESFKKNRLSNVAPPVSFDVNYKIPKIKQDCTKSEEQTESQLFLKSLQIPAKSIMKRRVSEEHKKKYTSSTNQIPPRRHGINVNTDQQKDTTLAKDVPPEGNSVSTSESIDNILAHFPIDPISETSKTKDVVMKKESRRVSFSNIIDVINLGEKAKVMKNVPCEKKADSVLRTTINEEYLKKNVVRESTPKKITPSNEESNKVQEINKDEIINKCKWGPQNLFKLGQNSEKPKVTITASKINKGQKRVSRINSVQNNQSTTSEYPRSKSNLTLEEYLQQRQSKTANSVDKTEHCEDNNANQATKESSEKSTIETTCPHSKDNSTYSSIQDYITKQTPVKDSIAPAPHMKNTTVHHHKVKAPGYPTKHRSTHDMTHKKQQHRGTKEIKTSPGQHLPNTKPHQVASYTKCHQKKKMVVATTDKMSLVKNTLPGDQTLKDNPCQDVSTKTFNDHPLNELKDISLPKGISLTVNPQRQVVLSKCVVQEKPHSNSLTSSNIASKSGTQEKIHLDSVTISKRVTQSMTHKSVNSSNNINKSISSNNVTKFVTQENQHMSSNSVTKSAGQEKIHVNPIKERRSSNSQLVVFKGESKIITTTKIQTSIKSKLDDKDTEHIPNKKPKLGHISHKLPLQSGELPKHSPSHEVKTKSRPHPPTKKGHIENNGLKTKIDNNSKCAKVDKRHLETLGYNSRKDNAEKIMFEVSKNVSIQYLENTAIECPVSPKEEKETGIEANQPTNTPAVPQVEEESVPGTNSPVSPKEEQETDMEANQPTDTPAVPQVEEESVPGTNSPVSPKEEQETDMEANQPTDTPPVPQVEESVPRTNSANDLISETNITNNTDDHLSETANVDPSDQTKTCNKSPGEMETYAPENSSEDSVELKEENKDSSEPTSCEPEVNTVDEPMSCENPIENHTLQSETSQPLTTNNEPTDVVKKALEIPVSRTSEQLTVKQNASLPPTSEIEPIDQALLTKAQLEYEKHRKEELANCPTLRSVLSPFSKKSPSPPLSLRILTPQEIARKFSNQTDSMGEVDQINGDSFAYNSQLVNPCAIQVAPTNEIISSDGHFLSSALDSPKIARSTNQTFTNSASAVPNHPRAILPNTTFNVDKHPAYQGVPSQPPTILCRRDVTNGVRLNHSLDSSINLPWNHVNPAEPSVIHTMPGERPVNTLDISSGRPILPKPSFNVGTHPVFHNEPSQASAIVVRPTKSSVRSKPTSNVKTKSTSSHEKPQKTTKRRKSNVDSTINSVISGEASVINGQPSVQLPYSSDPVQGNNHWNMNSIQTRPSSADEYISVEQWEALKQQTVSMNSARNYLQSYAEFLQSRANDNDQIIQNNPNYPYHRYPNTVNAIVQNGYQEMNGFNPGTQIPSQNIAHPTTQQNQNVALLQHNNQQPNQKTNTWYPPNYQNIQNQAIPLVTHNKNANVEVPQSRVITSHVESSHQNQSVENVHFGKYPSSQQGNTNIPTASIGNGQMPVTLQNKPPPSNNKAPYANRSMGPVQTNLQVNSLHPSSVNYPTLPSHPYFPYQNQLGTHNGNPIQNTNSNPQLNATYQNYNNFGSYQKNNKNFHVQTNVPNNNQVPAYNRAYENDARMVEYNRRLSNAQLDLSRNNFNEILSSNNPLENVIATQNNVTPISVQQNNPNENITREVLSSYHHTKYGGTTLPKTQVLVSSFHQRRYGDQYVSQALQNGTSYPNNNRSQRIPAATLSSENYSQDQNNSISCSQSNGQNKLIRTLLNGQTPISRLSSHHESSNLSNHQTMPAVTHEQANSENQNDNDQIKGGPHTDLSALQAILQECVRELNCPRQPTLPQDDPNSNFQNATPPNAVPVQNKYALSTQNHHKKQQREPTVMGNSGQNSSSNKPVSYPRKSMGKEAWVLEYLRQNSREQVDEASSETQTASPETSPQKTAAPRTTGKSFGILTTPESLLSTPVEMPTNSRTPDANCNNLEDTDDGKKSNPSRDSQCSNYDNILSDIVRETLVATTPTPCQIQSARTNKDTLLGTTPSLGKTKARRSSKSRNSLEEGSPLKDKQANFEKSTPSKQDQNDPSRTITPSSSKTKARRSSKSRNSLEEGSPLTDKQANFEKSTPSKQDQNDPSRTITPSSSKTKARRSSKSRNSLEEGSPLTDKQANFEKSTPSKQDQNDPSQTITPSSSKTKARRSSQNKRKSTEDIYPHADRQAHSEKSSPLERENKSPAMKGGDNSPKEGQKPPTKRRACIDQDDDDEIEIVHEKVRRSMSKDSGYSETNSVICYTGEKGTKTENDTCEDSDMSGIETITIDDEDNFDEPGSERTLLINLIKSKNKSGKWKDSWSEERIRQSFDCRVVLTPISIKEEKPDFKSDEGMSQEKVGTEETSLTSNKCNDSILDEKTGDVIIGHSDNLKKTIPIPKKSPSPIEQDFFQNQDSRHNQSMESSHGNPKKLIPVPKKSPSTPEKDYLPNKDSTATRAKPPKAIVLKANTTNPQTKFYNMYNPCFLILNQLRQCLNLTERDDNTMNSCMLTIASIVNEMFVLKMEQNFNIDSPCFKRIVTGYAKANKVQLILILSYYQDDVYRKLHEHIESTDGYVIGKHEDVKACLLELIWLARNIDLNATQQSELAKYMHLYKKLGESWT